MQDQYQRALPSGPIEVGWSSSRFSNPSSAMAANSFLNLMGTTGFAPTRVLKDKIRSRDWDAVRIRVLSHPWDARFRSRNMNNATPLHLACLYRAPPDVVQMILEANPEALFCQDSEGWTPLHVILLYGSDEETALMLIRRGGCRAASIHSQIVGAPLHLACRHGCSTAIIQELLKVNPAMATTANEYSTKPANILWHQFSRNPEHERLLNELLETDAQNNTDLPETEGRCMRELVDRLSLLLRAAKGKQFIHGDPPTPAVVIHDVVGATEETLRDLTQFLALIVLLYPEQVQSMDEMGNLPLHSAASSRPSQTRRNFRRTVSLPSSFASVGHSIPRRPTLDDPIEVLLRRYPTAASIPNHQGLLPLHIALAKGGRTWRTGVASMVGAAPQVLMTPDHETKLLPFQLAATTCSDQQQESVEVIETILELLLACPHAMTSNQ